MSKKRLLTLVACLVFAISMLLVVMKIQHTREGESAIPTTDVHKAMPRKSLKASTASVETEATLRKLFLEAEEWVDDVEARRIEAQDGDQRMGYGAAVDAAEDALTKLEAYRDSMTTEQLDRLNNLRKRLDE